MGGELPKRCKWCESDPVYVAYHDEEWGVPVRDDAALFEKLLLDGFQAGLSWLIILKKRQTIREAFDFFDPEKIARYDAQKVEKLLADPGIIRNRAKINAAITSAQAYASLRDEGGSFSHFLWDFVGGDTRHYRRRRVGQIPAKTKESEAMAKALKARGFHFCGPTITYAFMQAVGMVNDHLVDCFRHAQLVGNPR